MSTMSQESNLSEGELDTLEKSVKPVATARATLSGINKFNEWLERRQLQCDFHTISADDLNVILRKYYAEVKQK